MTAYATTHERRFTRDADRGVVAGVCAGIADYFGFRLCAVRFIFIIALFVVPLVQRGVNNWNKKRVDSSNKMASRITESISGISEIHAQGSFQSEESR